MFSFFISRYSIILHSLDNKYSVELVYIYFTFIYSPLNFPNNLFNLFDLKYSLKNFTSFLPSTQLYTHIHYNLLIFCYIHSFHQEH